MSAFAVAAFHGAYLPLGGSTVDAVVRIGASAIEEPGVEVSLRLWTPLGATVRVLREISLATRNLRDTAIRLDDRTVECPAGRWTGGAREYELGVALPPRELGDEMLAARLVVVAGGSAVGRALIAVAWTADEDLIAASTDSAVQRARTAGVAAADLPTWRSRQPRHTLAAQPPARESCPGCGLPPDDGDRFCEACGHELGHGTRSPAA